ncbi:uncharacterized protein LOC119840151 [Zerene cesonia]|uniref:uncharacterized protein LOC119840151 n=1 Tax=Zerene cesonia TaxID=33412 RepID=UPI0018E52B87|nr:uncharacterized protein LOC119840151 [Zerene cesonia]
MKIKSKIIDFCKIVRKYGLDYCELEDMLKNVAVLLRTVTLNIDKWNMKPIPLISYIFTILGFLCYFYIYLVSMLWCAFVRYRRSDYFLGSVLVFSLGAYTESCAIRLVFMVINGKTIREVVERYRVCNKQIEPGTRLSRNILKQLKIVKKRATFIWLTLVINAYFYLILPFFLPGKQFAENTLIVYGLEPITESPNYEIAQAMYCLAIPTATNSLANCTALIIILIGYTEASLLALSKELLSMWNDAETYYEEGDHTNSKSKIMNEFVNRRLIFIIKLHNENIILIKQLEYVLRVSMALEFLVLMAGMIAALLGGIENTYLEVPFAFAQLFMNCYLGQKTINASNSFETAVYGCKWENFDKANMKTVLIVLQNSQKTLQLSAGGVAILSFECLMSVVKSCYSFYTTLQSTLK